MMEKIKRLFSFGNLTFVISLSMLFIQCTEEELIQPEMNEAPAAVVEAPARIASFTISGIHTAVEENIDCASCTYVVPSNIPTVDATALGIKPGSVICLDKAIEYGMLEIENIIGTEEQPVVIGYCGE